MSCVLLKKYGSGVRAVGLTIFAPNFILFEPLYYKIIPKISQSPTASIKTNLPHILFFIRPLSSNSAGLTKLLAPHVSIVKAAELYNYSQSHSGSNKLLPHICQLSLWDLDNFWEYLYKTAAPTNDKCWTKLIVRPTVRLRQILRSIL
jgi:hypothetical protein